MIGQYLRESGKVFFVNKERLAFVLRVELKLVIGYPAFVEQMLDVNGYRTMNYYQRLCRARSME